MADDFPVGDFTPGTKERPERWRWVELGPAACGCLRARAVVVLCWSARKMCPRVRQRPGTQEALWGFFIMFGLTQRLST